MEVTQSNMEMIQIPREEYEQLKEENKILKELIASLTKKITELDARLNKNSKNSNNPPSSDGSKKGAVKNSRVASGKKSGGQLEHEGKTIELTPSPDTIIELKPKTKCECGGEITIKADEYTKRQVTDIEPAKVVTIEYRAHDGECVQCGQIHKAGFPENVEGTVSYGEKLHTFVTYLTNYQLLPLKRATELLEDVFGIRMSQGTIVSINQEAYEKLEEAEAVIKEGVINSDVVHFDESGMRVCGTNQWLHSASTQDSTVYSIHEKRGREAMDDMGILPNFRGTAIHDHWKSYYCYDQCAHGECNAHHIRHLIYLYEDLGAGWANEMLTLLLRVERHVELSRLFGADCLMQEDIEAYEKIYREILTNAAATQEKPAVSVEIKRMINRLTKYEQETLLFMYDFSVPFTNNLSERDIRMPKAKQKISGGFRSAGGAKAFARTRGYISTVKKRGINILEGLDAVFRGGALKFLSQKPIST